jgi:hypothetical protein
VGRATRTAEADSKARRLKFMAKLLWRVCSIMMLAGTLAPESDASIGCRRVAALLREQFEGGVKACV